MLGVYDPNLQLVHQDQILVEHLFIAFEDIDNGTFKKDLDKIRSRSHIPFITLEPRIPQDRDNKKVLSKLLNGDFDRNLDSFYDLLKEHDSFVRFAHEMEIPVDRYPWQNQDPGLYIRAFQYVMKPLIPYENVSKVWGPAGDKASMDFWPGTQYVDYIGMAIYGLPDKNITAPLEQESFEKIYNKKYRRLRFLPKPFLIAEFGVMGDKKFQDAWLNNAAEVLGNDKRIRAAIYFNHQDVPEAWGDIEPPQWQIAAESFEDFATKLNEKGTTK